MRSASLEQRFEAHRAGMSAGAIRVAQYLLEHPDRAMVASAAEIAHSLQTSDATVVRAVQKLGYMGLPELRRSIGDEWASRPDPRDSLEKRVARVKEDSRSLLDIMIADAINLLAATSSAMDHDGFDKSVDILRTARRIFVFGWGEPGSLADYLAIGLNRIGSVAAAHRQSGFQFADALLGLRPGDTVVVIAPLWHVNEIDVALKRASNVGAKTILISELLGEKLRHRFDCVLTTASSRHGTAEPSVPVVVILDALLLGVASSNSEQALESWTVMNKLRSSLLKPSSNNFGAAQ
jgi:DNA-binding MurR/RpiR family transcriptional regulator